MAAVIHHVNPDQPFKMLKANIFKHKLKLNATQVVSSVDEHPDFITKSSITHDQMWSTTKSDNEYLKHDKNVSVDKFNNHTTDAILTALRTQDEIPNNSENVEIHGSKEYHSRICALL